ncbi:YaeQ family protein, partial [Salmonella enterica subsp. enterica serovar Anatum]|nr:YaeQ family protein [Salmonella enterica subsp. enterica serovar Anatum]
LWIELGLPDERRIKKACTQASDVALFAYNTRAAQIWWQQHQSKCAQFANLSVWYLDDGQLAQLSEFADRTMTLQATIQDGAIWLSDARNNLEIQLTAWQQPS